MTKIKIKTWGKVMDESKTSEKNEREGLEQLTVESTKLPRNELKLQRHGRKRKENKKLIKQEGNCEEGRNVKTVKRAER